MFACDVRRTCPRAEHQSAEMQNGVAYELGTFERAAHFQLVPPFFTGRKTPSYHPDTA